MAEQDGRVRRAAESRESRRRQILDTALTVFSEKGYHRSSITDVVKAAGVARGTFYLYFDSKAAIFRELLDNLSQQLRESVVGVNLDPDAPPAAQQLMGTIVRVLHTVEQNRRLTRILFREAIGLEQDIDQRLTAFFDELRSYVASSLERGKSMNMVRADLDSGVASIVTIGAVREVVTYYVIERDDPFDVQQVAVGLLDTCLRGVFKV